ncbi:Pyrroline-5-carboxylate reductase 1, mitochondrial [Papilio machaon]|uniref:Pyrroline-5-carboxylate reductase 3 n=1 Tax=Papilio machaon TaxID=76193 RepID=A0A0N0PF62_PAPMA|nr:Pyrroline-5-carboxylate reductase 1, mitochondrial [Papilio machaon]
MSITIGFIGGGNMSTAIAKGILRNDSYSASQIWVSGPHTAHLKHWEEMGANVTDKNGEVLSKCDVVFLGVKPGVLSYAAFKVFDFPTSVIRIMPNTPMSVGAGICLYTPDDTIKPEQCMLLEKLLNSCGICEKVSETLMNSGSCLPGCGPAFMYIVIEALADGAVKQGVPRAMALRWASQVLVGSGEMVLQSKKHPGHLKDEVCSPGGSTICGVTALENGRLRFKFFF